MTDLNLDRYAGGGGWRRSILVMLVVVTTCLGAVLMSHVLGLEDGRILDLAVLAVFTVSFAWIGLSFWASVIGFVLHVLGRHPVTLQRRFPASGPLPPLRARTAILMPIYNEDPQQAFGRVISTYRSLAATGQLDAFDFFVLSDTRDDAIARRELVLWMELRAALDTGRRLFYRRRPLNLGRKAGNIVDWLDMYSHRYEHMVVLDADSVMSGETIVRIAALMEANPKTGIIQTLAQSVGRETLFARSLQFASRLYGSFSAAGHSFWQLGDANYYGHNAILRTSAFAELCRLPILPGTAPLGGEILSHDFVEAAFIRRGGWHVWLLPELDGSFEQVPSNLLDYAARDRRWVQGNLQHGRLIGTPGLRLVSRLHLGMGILGYAASPLWLLLLMLSGAVMIGHELQGPVYFGAERTLFPLWPTDRAVEVQSLLGLTALLLFGPKVWALLATLVSRSQTRRFGGSMALLASAGVELFTSMLMAPVMMLIHTEFIARILCGRAVGWTAQARDDRGVSWSVAARRHAWHVAIGAASLSILWWGAPAYLPWVAPVIVGLLAAIPFTVVTSWRRSGLWARSLGLLVTPEEREPPGELRTLQPERPRRKRHVEHATVGTAAADGVAGEPV
ncbi:MAG: glucans biosynthesis glucosyltransferase MdoH [Alphaproteobacteria bacterium]|nr:glucans biosynthesis glucosyltransferase MdoH [Alphaproteobacteria bacterium]